MKKVLTLVLALMMAVCLAVPAFAIDSITDDTTFQADGGKEVTVSAPTADVTDAKATLESLGVSVTGTPSVVYLHNLDCTDLPVTVTFTVANADSNDKLYVLHWNGSAWEKVGNEATGKTITVTFNTLSPVAVVMVSVTNPSTPSTSTSTSTPSAPTAPQTGAPMAVPFIGLAVIALAGIVAFKARKKEM